MKKLLHLKNEKGFTLPVALLSTTLVLLYLTSNLLAYSQDMKMTATLIEQLKAQALFEMSYKKYKRDQLSHDKREALVEYVFPDGKTTITVTEGLETIHLRFSVMTVNGFHYAVTKSLKSPTIHDSSHNLMEYKVLRKNKV